MDDEPEDQQPVRILSTLASARHTAQPSRSKGGRRPQKSHRRSWLQGALWGAMGVGVLALMAGFVMVLQDSKPAKAQVMSAPAIVVRAAAPSKQDMHAPSVEAGPAVIETTQGEAPLAALSTATNVAPAAKTALTVAANIVTPAKAGKAAATTKGQDEDVALLEAMFEHTGRKAPPKPTAPTN
jgi:hypothetical protein